MGLFKKFRDAWFAPMSFDSLDDDFYDRLEESLILADVGMDVALDATEKLRRRAYDDRLLTADLPPIQRCAAGGEIYAQSERAQWPPSAAGSAGVHRRECRRLAAETKGGKGTVWFPCPLLTPPNPPSSRSAKHSRLNGGYGGSVPCVGQISGRCYALNSLCVIGSAVSARPDGAGRSPCSAKSSASIKR